MESASEDRLLAAKHVTERVTERASRALNRTLDCNTLDAYPDFKSYSADHPLAAPLDEALLLITQSLAQMAQQVGGLLTFWNVNLKISLQLYGPVIWCCGALLACVSLGIFIMTLRALKKHRQDVSSHAFVLAVYPVVTTAAFIATLLPRARLLCEALSQQAVMVGMCHLYWVLIDECGGVDQLISRATGARLETRVLPCCCWPCCLLPRPALSRKNLRTVSYLVLQMPIVQGVLYAIYLILWTEDKILYHDSYIIIQPIVITSILTGVWGIIITVKAALAAGTTPRPKFLAIQIALLVVKLQGGFAKMLPEIAQLPCLLRLNSKVFVNLLHNCGMIFEMLLLSLWAYWIYSKAKCKVIGKVQQVVVATTENIAVDLRLYRDGLQNHILSKSS